MGDSSIERECREVYVFDQRTANILNAIPLSASGEDLMVYFFRQDPWLSKKASYYYWLDWILLLLSMVAKLVEFIVLWRCGARILTWTAIFCWFFFFSAVIALQFHGIQRRAPVPEIDIIAGSLPTCSRAGGARKILLGIPKSTRHHVLWRFIWGLGGIVGITTVIATYLALGHSTSTEVFFLWTGFQVLWLAIRSTLFYLLSDREGRYHVGLKGKPWVEVKPQDRARLRRLVFALSKYQVHLHPRTSLSYAGDIDVVDSVENVRSEYPLYSYDKEIIPISILQRYYDIADRRVRLKMWSKEDMAATNAVFWDGEHWDRSEPTIIRSRNFPSKLPGSTHVDFLPGSTLDTITMTFQGVYSVYIVSMHHIEGDVPTFFAPLAIIGLFRLQSALWLSDEGAYLPLGAAIIPCIQSM
jgi:hypothetical protein